MSGRPCAVSPELAAGARETYYECHPFIYFVPGSTYLKWDIDRHTEPRSGGSWKYNPEFKEMRGPANGIIAVLKDTDLGLVVDVCAGGVVGWDYRRLLDTRFGSDTHLEESLRRDVQLALRTRCHGWARAEDQTLDAAIRAVIESRRQDLVARVARVVERAPGLETPSPAARRAQPPVISPDGQVAGSRGTSRALDMGAGDGPDFGGEEDAKGACVVRGAVRGGDPPPPPPHPHPHPPPHTHTHTHEAPMVGDDLGWRDLPVLKQLLDSVPVAPRQEAAGGAAADAAAQAQAQVGRRVARRLGGGKCASGLVAEVIVPTTERPG